MGKVGRSWAIVVDERGGSDLECGRSPEVIGNGVVIGVGLEDWDSVYQIPKWSEIGTANIHGVNVKLMYLHTRLN